ncbi:tRNA (adenosine(37)-N6)-threonylcarbamoyltransferase complex ATPase subunit type 1 TsaE [Rickettsia endosymbiont of Cardiosporidium cionae]|uniref:tRNA (adenosine(37)-N6)-threonylcarbamoyltransferase complex ATPase subunit type 1 TsaE n=1 Tax=Rickettsia endosymbiont of Cardiosporidium cionae TaxID=2777155 RepID=UPI0018952347|nr:tRNA (adenosine(37)-N6)-threonylcarbamoyltransferase complex ATPase subunit type 1 TsaE [Rickettsia endosymbiont of Cardiosporidium cionae]KAF8818163.1 tRNA (adenosine(37)-N6)-threonylcarbamoyltransferase complex ATPase subunit type 1 TsaE [Rickettsia endosymbiont of Cardiosporidium cionae]
MLQEFIIDNYKNFLEITKNIAISITNNTVITFDGELGSGKTSFCREIINHLSKDPVHVTSPSFNIIQIYKLQQFDIYHLDLYRLNSINELYEIGIENMIYTNNVLFIEWPQIIRNFLPETNRIEIKIQILGLNKRKYIIQKIY